jgi:uncharacterized protein (DUF488 family)
LLIAQLTAFTIGHSNRSLAELLEILRAFEIATLVDIRRYPRSRTHPQFDGERLSRALRRAGIGYVHAEALGGRRGRKDVGPVAVTHRFDGWEVDAFRAYAAYATTPPFRHAVDALAAQARRSRTVILCAEAAWWRCHRRIVSDYLMAEGFSVCHILGVGRAHAGSPTPFVRRERDGTLSYPASSS